MRKEKLGLPCYGTDVKLNCVVIFMLTKMCSCVTFICILILNPNKSDKKYPQLLECTDAMINQNFSQVLSPTSSHEKVHLLKSISLTYFHVRLCSAFLPCIWSHLLPKHNRFSLHIEFVILFSVT